MLKSILTFLFPKTIASIKQDSINEYFADEDRRYFESNEELWREINEYEERMHLEHQQWLEQDENI
jgi:hypothetical protein